VALLEKRRFLYNHSGDFPQVILIVPSHVPNRTLEFCFGNNEATQIHFWEIHKSEPNIYIGLSQALHMQCVILTCLLHTFKTQIYTFEIMTCYLYLFECIHYTWLYKVNAQPNLTFLAFYLAYT
jgi:hypothetical protein